MCDSLADGRQRRAEHDHAVEFNETAKFPPLGMVHILLAPPLIDASSKDVATRVGGNPDVSPGGRDGEADDSLPFVERYTGPVSVPVCEALALLVPRIALVVGLGIP